jgi:hypothetical protein
MASRPGHGEQRRHLVTVIATPRVGSSGSLGYFEIVSICATHCSSASPRLVEITETIVDVPDTADQSPVVEISLDQVWTSIDS